MMKNIIVKAFIFISLSVWAFPQTSAEQSLRRYLVSPDFLRRNQQELQLTEDQREFIVQEINRIQSEFTSAKWKLQDEIERLTSLIRTPGSEEPVILEQLDVVLNLEKEIKRTQLILAVRIKNTLNEKQLAKLRTLRSREARNSRIPARKINPAPRR
jgi:predicted ATP-dependent Lon-type protease